jgi:hypothetical protein
MKRMLWVIGVPLAVLILLVLAGWYVLLRPIQQHRAIYERVEDAVESLEDRCPASIAPQKWYCAVGWTKIALGNCLCVREFLKDGQDIEEDFSRFADELERKVQGKVGPETIAWVWDEIERLSKGGKSYSDRFRPMTDGQLKEPDMNWTSIPKPPFTASHGSSIFHRTRSECVTKLRHGDRRWYSTYGSAIQDGKQPCPVCQPHDNGEPATGVQSGEFPRR